MIKLIRTAPDPATAREQLMERDWPASDVGALVELIDDPRHKVSETGTYKLSEEQARAILDLRLQRLTALGRDEIGDELTKLGDQISDYLDILRSRPRIFSIIKDELIAVREEFATPRRTELVEGGADFDDEDLIAREEMVVTVSHTGYIKRVPLSTYRAQRRGGKGRSGMAMKEEDFVTRLFVVNTHTPVLFFSSRGIVYKLKVWRLPLGGPTSRGKALVNLLPLEAGETINTIMPLPEDEDTWGELDVMFATTKGSVRRNKLSDFTQVNRNGKIAMKLEEEDGSIINVETCRESDDVLMTTSLGQAIRFPVTAVRVFQSRASTGVRGISLADGDSVISMCIINHFDATSDERAEYLKRRRLMRGETEDVTLEGEGEGEEGAVTSGSELSETCYVEMSAIEQHILTISENGFGKRTSSFEYRITGRGGKGIAAMTVNDRNGNLIASFPVEDSDQIMLVTDGGQLIRCPVDGIRVAGRSTQGVTVFHTAEGEHVVAVERISEDALGENGDDDLDEGAEGPDGPEGTGPDDAPDGDAAGDATGEASGEEPEA